MAYTFYHIDKGPNMKASQLPMCYHGYISHGGQCDKIIAPMYGLTWRLDYCFGSFSKFNLALSANQFSKFNSNFGFLGNRIKKQNIIRKGNLLHRWLGSRQSIFDQVFYLTVISYHW